MTDNSPVNVRRPSVFVSYSRKDLKSARPVIAAIEAAGYSVWWDGMLTPGERFLTTTANALEKARAVVVLWSATSVQSDWVQDEATRGRERGCLVPITIDGSRPPLGFGQFHTYAVNTAHAAKDPGIEAMLQAIAALHGSPAQQRVTQQLGAPRIGRRAALIGGAAILAGAGAGWAWWDGLFGAHAGDNSVAVLPFVNLSGDADSRYFSDGLAAEVRSQLAAEPLLTVAARASSNQFRDISEDAATISQALGVAYLLEGSVRRTNERVRVTAELIDGKAGLSRWAQTFDRKLDNVFAVQDEIAEAVINALAQEMATRGVKVTAKTVGGTTSFAAYDAYLRGKDLYEQATNQATDVLALSNFDKAVALDPDYAIAHAARARALAVMGNLYDEGERRRTRYGEAIAAAERAVALAPNLADAQAALGFALFDGNLDARAARAPYSLAYQLGRGNVDVLTAFGLFEARCGRLKTARAAISRAADLDPLNAGSFRQVGEVEYCARRWAASIPPIEQALKLNPEMSVAHSVVGSATLMLGNVSAASKQFAMERSSAFRLPGQAIIALRRGRFDEARELVEQLEAEHGDNSLYQRAQVLAQWGRRGEALDLLETAYREVDSGLIYLHNDPFVDPLRNEARFIHLLDIIGFS